MASRSLVDPELLPVLDLAPNFTVSAQRLEAARAEVAEMTKLALADPDPTVTAAEYRVPGYQGAGEVRLVLYKPAGLAPGAPVVLQIHGGGFVFGTAEVGDPINRALAKAVGCAVAAVEYRLAPETPFPGALDDCYAALDWLHRQAPALDLDPARIAVRGESAGGGLAAALAIMARDLGGPPVCCQLLIYPMLDDRTVAAPAHPFAGEFVWDGASNHYGWKAWLNAEPGSADIPALAAPARAQDLRSLPSTVLLTAALDMFAEENLEYARRLLRAGVPTELYLAPGAFHGFDAMAPDAAVSRRFTQHGIDALKRAFAR